MHGSPTVHEAPDQPGIDPELHAIAHQVHQEFDNHLDPQEIDECLHKMVSQFEGAAVRTFVPLLVRRYVREELSTRLRLAQGPLTG